MRRMIFVITLFTSGLIHAATYEAYTNGWCEGQSNMQRCYADAIMTQANQIQSIMNKVTNNPKLPNEVKMRYQNAVAEQMKLFEQQCGNNARCAYRAMTSFMYDIGAMNERLFKQYNAHPQK